LIIITMHIQILFHYIFNMLDKIFVWNSQGLSGASLPAVSDDPNKSGQVGYVELR
jgi:hypothetical protein